MLKTPNGDLTLSISTVVATTGRATTFIPLRRPALRPKTPHVGHGDTSDPHLQQTLQRIPQTHFTEHPTYGQELRPK
jgi:hypothetical protein